MDTSFIPSSYSLLKVQVKNIPTTSLSRHDFICLFSLKPFFVSWPQNGRHKKTLNTLLVVLDELYTNEEYINSIIFEMIEKK